MIRGIEAGEQKSSKRQDNIRSLLAGVAMPRMARLLRHSPGDSTSDVLETVARRLRDGYIKGSIRPMVAWRIGVLRAPFGPRSPVPRPDDERRSTHVTTGLRPRDPRLSNCGLDVGRMDTTFRSHESKYNVRWVR